LAALTAALTDESKMATMPVILGVIDAPQVLIFRSDPLVVTGWVVGVASVRELSVWIDGRFAGQAEYGIPRPDVEQAHPQYPNAVNSGFRFESAPLDAAAPEKIEIAIEVSLESYETGRLTRTLLLFGTARAAAESIDAAVQADAATLLRIADALLSDADFIECERVLGKAVERFPADPAIAVARAKFASVSRNWALAIDRWQAIAEAGSAGFQEFLQFGLALREARRFDAANEVLRETISRFPGRSGDILEALDQADAARRVSGGESLELTEELNRFADAARLVAEASRIDLRLPEHFPYRDIVTEISPRDAMYEGSVEHYLSVGLSALSAIRRVTTRAADWEPEHVLDMPCGHGRVARFLRAAFPRCSMAVSDVDRNGVDFCADRFDAVGFYSEADFQHLDFACRFDLIWVGSLVTHFDAPKITTFFDFLGRHLRPNGVAVVTTAGPLIAGSVRQAVMNRSPAYGLTLSSMSALLAAYFDTGFAFAPYQEDPTGQYGISICSEQWLRTRLVEMRFKVLSYEHHGWDNHQDVVAFSADAGLV
jgi:SAM-dependent methyltransferase